MAGYVCNVCAMQLYRGQFQTAAQVRILLSKYFRWAIYNSENPYISMAGNPKNLVSKFSGKLLKQLYDIKGKTCSFAWWGW